MPLPIEHPLADLAWTSREDVCDRLARFLQEVPPTPLSAAADVPDVRSRAASLFALMAHGSCVPMLLQILTDPKEDRSVRRGALAALVGLGASLPVAELEALLREGVIWRHEHNEDPEVEILGLCRSDEARQVAQAFLDACSSRERAEFLMSFGVHRAIHGEPIAPAIIDWLYEQWISRDRAALEGVRLRDHSLLNVWVAKRTSDRSTSRQLLRDHWVRSQGEARSELLDALRYEADLLAECVAGNAVEARQMAEALLLPYAVLVTHFGSAEELLVRIEATIREVNDVYKVVRLQGNCIDEEAWRSQRAIEEETRYRLWRVERLLREWPGEEIGHAILSLLSSPDLDSEVREEFCGVVWNQCRAQAGALSLTLVQKLRDRELPIRLLRWMVFDPVPEDREFLLWAVGQKRWSRLRYYALRGLEALGEEGPEWRHRLAELRRDRDDRVRVRAAAALGRRGDKACLREVAHEAETAADVVVRAEAIWALADVAAREYQDLFIRVLLTDHEELREGYSTPVAEEAAVALVELGTSEALTAFLQAYLTGPDYVWSILDSPYLPTLLERIEGREAPLDMSHLNWRQLAW